jgi:hypothetical protein
MEQKLACHVSCASTIPAETITIKTGERKEKKENKPSGGQRNQQIFAPATAMSIGVHHQLVGISGDQTET